MSVEHITSLSKFNRIIRDENRLVVVDFHATWCGPCHAIAPFYEKLAKTYDGRARFLKVDVDDAEEISSQCNVSAMPTFQMFLDGTKVSSFSGADPNRLQAEIERHAPSSQDISFSGSGQRLGDSASSSTAPPTSSSSDDRRTSAAEAATRRAEAARVEREREKEKEKEKEKQRREKEKREKEAKAKAKARAREEREKEERREEEQNALKAVTPVGNDSRLKVDQTLLNQLVYDMGFPRVRAEKALILTQNKSVELAVDWCFDHADDPDVDEPLQVVTEDGQPKQKLTPEEAKKKADQLYSKARARRQEEDRKMEIQREKDRIKSGKEMRAAKDQYEEDARKRAVEQKKREKREALAERERVRRMLEADKARRREKFRMPGANTIPNAGIIPTAQPQSSRIPSSQSVAGGKIQFRLPDGSRIEGQFDADQTLEDLIKFLVETRPELVGQNLMLNQQYPRKTFSLDDYGARLSDLNLFPRGALTVTIG